MSLLKSRFIEMFGHPMNNDKNLTLQKFGDVFELNAGGTPSKNKKEYWDGGEISWIGSNMCHDEVLYTNDGKYITKEGLTNSSAKLFPVDTVLIALVGATIGRTALLKFETTTNQNIIGIRKIREAGYIPEFVFFYTQGLYKKFTEKGEGFFMATKGFISELPIPKVEIKAQKRFVDFAKQIDKSKFLLQQILEKLELLKKSRFIEIYEKEKSKEVSLSDVCDVRDGTHDSPKFVSEGYPLITSKNVTSGVINFDNVNFISKDDFDSINKRSKVDINDIIMPMIGTIGCPVIVDTDTQFAIKNVALIKTSKTEKLLPTYICAFLNSKYFHSQLRSLSRGCTQKFISLGNIRSIKLKALSDDSQKEICSFINQIDKSKLIIQKALDDLVGKV